LAFYFSEFALIRYRVRVEVEYFKMPVINNIIYHNVNELAEKQKGVSIACTFCGMGCFFQIDDSRKRNDAE
jgi:predicted molibdopterin-dependent oxidoreductase YjgC